MEEKIVYSDILKASWKGFKSQIWILAGLLIGYIIIYSLLYIYAMPTPGASIKISSIIVSILCICFSCLFVLGYMKNCFQTLDGEEPQFSAYGQMSRKLVSYFVAALIFEVIIIIGFALLIIPGIYLMLRLQFFLASMVDENTGIIESLKRSWEITKGQTLKLFFIFLIMLAFIIAGCMIFFVGIFVSIPLIMLMYGYTFRKLTLPSTK